MIYTYNDVRRSVLSLIRQYSIAGDPVSPAYNNQEDYLNQIAQRINEALVQIRTTSKKEIAHCELSNGDDYYGSKRYSLPDDFIGFVSGSLTGVIDGKMFKVRKWRMLGTKDILLPDDGDEYFFEYYRYPQQIPYDAKDDYTIDEDPDVMQAAIYYAAAQLVREDSAFDFAALNNEFASRMAMMVPQMTASVEGISDVYLGDCEVWHM